MEEEGGGGAQHHPVRGEGGEVLGEEGEVGEGRLEVEGGPGRGDQGGEGGQGEVAPAHHPALWECL